MERTFHVELTIRKWVEVKVDGDDFDDADEMGEEVQTLAIENFWNSQCTWGDDYEFEEIKEIASPKTESA